jgi:hypothetical protein
VVQKPGNGHKNAGFIELYRDMFAAIQAGREDAADKIRIQMEALRAQAFPKPHHSLIEKMMHRLPGFAAHVLNRTQTELGRSERSNCINAAFNFHDPLARWETYSTGEFLERTQSGFVQAGGETPAFGDLIVMWSRTPGGSWEDRKIDVHAMNGADPDFPYGLVFDHVVVFLTGDLVFHKPDPTPSSAYQIDFLNAVAAPLGLNFGFEITCHRKSL